MPNSYGRPQPGVVPSSFTHVSAGANPEYAEETTIERGLRMFYTGLFGVRAALAAAASGPPPPPQPPLRRSAAARAQVLYTMSKDVSSSFTLSFIMFILDFLQLMSFPVSRAKFAWSSSTLMRPISDVLGYISLSRVVSGVAQRSLQSAMFYGSLCWVASIMMCALWCGYSFTQTRFRVMCVLPRASGGCLVPIERPRPDNLPARPLAPGTAWTHPLIRHPQLAPEVLAIHCSPVHHGSLHPADEHHDHRVPLRRRRDETWLAVLGVDAHRPGPRRGYVRSALSSFSLGLTPRGRGQRSSSSCSPRCH